MKQQTINQIQPMTTPAQINLVSTVKELRSVIASRSLYHATHGRCVNARLKKGKIVVERLNDGVTVPFDGQGWRDGYGEPVTL